MQFLADPRGVPLLAASSGTTLVDSTQLNCPRASTRMPTAELFSHHQNECSKFTQGQI